MVAAHGDAGRVRGDPDRPGRRPLPLHADGPEPPGRAPRGRGHGRCGLATIPPGGRRPTAPDAGQPGRRRRRRPGLPGDPGRPPRRPGRRERRDRVGGPNGRSVRRLPAQAGAAVPRGNRLPRRFGRAARNPRLRAGPRRGDGRGTVDLVLDPLSRRRGLVGRLDRHRAWPRRAARTRPGSGAGGFGTVRRRLADRRRSALDDADARPGGRPALRGRRQPGPRAHGPHPARRQPLDELGLRRADRRRHDRLVLPARAPRPLGHRRGEPPDPATRRASRPLLEARGALRLGRVGRLPRSGLGRVRAAAEPPRRPHAGRRDHGSRDLRRNRVVAGSLLPGVRARLHGRAPRAGPLLRPWKRERRLRSRTRRRTFRGARRTRSGDRHGRVGRHDPGSARGRGAGYRRRPGLLRSPGRSAGRLGRPDR